MTLASDLIAITSQSKNQVQAAKFKITQHLNYLLNQANWSPISSDPNDHSRAYPKSEQERLVAATNEEYAELEREKALGKFNNLIDDLGFNVLEFYSSEKNRLFGQYCLNIETVVTMHTARQNIEVLGTEIEEKTEKPELKHSDELAESKSAEPKTSVPDIQIIHPNGNIIVGSTFPDGIIRIYAPDNGTLVRSFSQHGFGVDAMTILPNGNLVAAGNTSPTTIRIYNPENGTLVQSISEKLGVLLMATALNGNIVVLSSTAGLEPYFRTEDYIISEYLPDVGTLAKPTKLTSKAISSPLGLLAINGGIEIEIGKRGSKEKLSICIGDYQAPSIYDEITIEIPEANNDDPDNAPYIQAGKEHGSIDVRQNRANARFLIIRFSTPEQILKFINIFLTQLDFYPRAEQEVRKIQQPLISYQVAVNKPELICNVIISNIVGPKLDAITELILAHDFKGSDHIVNLEFIYHDKFVSKLVTKPICNVMDKMLSFSAQNGTSFNAFKNIYISMLSEFSAKPMLKDARFFKFMAVNPQPDLLCAELYNKILEVMRESKLLWAFDAHKVILDKTKCSNDVANIIVGYSL